MINRPVHVTVEKVSKVYSTIGGQRVVALEDFSLEIAKGEFVCVTGKSGCGKSTLLNLVAGILAPSSGSVRIDGRAVDEARKEIGYMQQHVSLLPYRTALQNAALALELRGGLSTESIGGVQSLLDNFCLLTSRIRSRANCLAECDSESLSPARSPLIASYYWAMNLLQQLTFRAVSS